jgi:hypothetical protein
MLILVYLCCLEGKKRKEKRKKDCCVCVCVCVKRA